MYISSEKSLKGNFKASLRRHGLQPGRVRGTMQAILAFVKENNRNISNNLLCPEVIVLVALTILPLERVQGPRVVAESSCHYPGLIQLVI